MFHWQMAIGTIVGKMVGSLRDTKLGTQRDVLICAALTSAALLQPLVAQAQSERAPIRILVGFPPGGTIDVVARLLADQLKTDLAAPVIVDSRPGAGGQIAAQALKQAPADGRTLLLSPDHTMVMLPLTVKSAGFVPLSDFAPVGLVARYAGGFAVANSTNARSLSEFFTWVKSNPGQGNIGIPAPGSVPQFLTYMLGQQAQLALTPVPYRGSAPLLQELLGGQIAAGTTALGDFIEHHNAGKLRVIGVLSNKRSSLLPEIPTFIEQGYKVDWEYWLGLFAPAQTAGSEIARLNAAVGRALARPEIRERLQKIVFEPAHGSPEQLSDLIKSGTAFWEPVVKSSGWVPQ